MVSIPSQAGILLAEGFVPRVMIRASCLNTLSGGHPLGGPLRLAQRVSQDRLNTLSGGHPLGGWLLDFESQYHGSLNTLSGGHPLGGLILVTLAGCGDGSQYPLRRASSWREVDLARSAEEVVGLNTLSGGHPLGGWSLLINPMPIGVSIPSQAGILLAEPAAHDENQLDHVSIPSQAGILLADAYRLADYLPTKSQYPLRRASSWRAIGTLLMLIGLKSQYPLRRASSWRSLLRVMATWGSFVSIPSQAGILLAATMLRSGPVAEMVSIPSQAGILLAAPFSVPAS